MDPILPAREAIAAHGWKFQVQWVEDGRPCFHRTKHGAVADSYADQLRAAGHKPVVFDLVEMMQLH